MPEEGGRALGGPIVPVGGPMMQLFRAQDLRQACDFTFWTTSRAENPFLPSRFDQPVVTVFCQTDHVFEFFKWARGKLHRFVVVTHESDHTLSREHFASRPWNLVHWLGANCAVDHPDCTPLPLGLANDSSDLTPKRAHFDRAFSPSAERHRLLYVNHREETNPDARSGLKDFFRQYPWATVEDAPPRDGLARYMDALASHQFVLCPPGNGVDTHRMWEVLAAGGIPVVLRSEVTRLLSGMAPMVLVHDFRQVTQEFLMERLAGMLDTKFPPSSLDADQWTSRVEKVRLFAGRVSPFRLGWNWLVRKMKRW